jgi:hypothetical protein
MDGTERRRERPQDKEQQKRTYSGKKKTHTVKNILVVNETTSKVVYLGPTEPGSKHDILSGVRIVVEHAIADVKHCHIVKDVLRLTMDRWRHNREPCAACRDVASE